MNELASKHLETLSLGATLLGSGGGGDPAILYNHLHYLLEKNGPVRLVQPSLLPPKALVVPLALIGAPLISLERIPNSRMFLKVLEELKSVYPDQELILMPAEIGGCNALTPFMVAAQTALPVLDADLIGRAFPQLQMSKPAIRGRGRQQTFMASVFGDSQHFETHSLTDLESKARQVAVDYGCSAALASFLFRGEEQADFIIPGSLSRAMELGRLLRANSRELSHFAAATFARIIGEGVLTEVRHAIENGFLTGYALLSTVDQDLRIYFQNEYLLVSRRSATGEQAMAESPEIISLIERDSGLPVTSESLRYGLKVDILVMSAPDFWMEPAARAQVSLEVFGLKHCLGELNV